MNTFTKHHTSGKGR